MMRFSENISRFLLFVFNAFPSVENNLAVIFDFENPVVRDRRTLRPEKRPAQFQDFPAPDYPRIVQRAPVDIPYFRFPDIAAFLPLYLVQDCPRRSGIIANQESLASK